jgi:hypothetical protein
MTETREEEGTVDNQQKAPARKPWHVPQFIAMDVEATDVVCNGGIDGGPMGSAS